MIPRRGARRLRPESSELVSLRERLGHLRLLRVAMVGLVMGSPVFVPPHAGFLRPIVIPTAAYAVTVGLLDVIQARRAGPRIGLLGASLLLDAAYLGWATYATGGSSSPLAVLPLAHVAAVTLLASYRTGLKIAGWYSLLFLAFAYGQSAGLLEVREAVILALPGRGAGFARTAAVEVGALWILALVTGAFAAVSERQLRRQKVDLAELSETSVTIGATEQPSAIPGILLDRLIGSFGFLGGAVLASPAGDLEVMAARGAVSPEAFAGGLDPSMDRAWTTRRPQLVSRLAAEDPVLAALFPGARNVLVVPLFVEGERRLGILALHRGGPGDSMPRWVVDIVQQFAAHAALGLHNAWLLEEVRNQLAENRQLQQRLVRHNLELELRVQERTRELQASYDDLRRVDEQRRRLLSHVVHAAEAERLRLAGDIHDDPIQKMVAVNMRLQMLQRALDDPEQREDVARLVEAVRTSIASLRSLLFELRPSVLDEDGLAAALTQYLEREGSPSFEIHDRLGHEPPPETRVILYRIAQEALANVRKHAQAERVNILLAARDEGFLVEIRDDGVGFEPAEGPGLVPDHIGLVSMRERAQMAGGWCKVHAVPGRGTTVEFWLPPDPAPVTDRDQEARAIGSSSGDLDGQPALA